MATHMIDKLVDANGDEFVFSDRSKAEAGTASPLMDGKASVGNSLKYAREDHVHPSDTSKEDKANKTTVVLGTSNSKYPTDKAVAEFVNSSIATNTANYISNNGEPFTSVEQLEAYSGPVTNNDYAFVTGTDSEGNTYYDRYKATVSGETVTWALEYRLNNSSFTAAQWAAINSGITSVLVAKIHDHSNKDVLDGITSDKVNSWDGKEDAFNILPTTKGGTGTNAASKSVLTSTLINSLSIGDSTPSDADYYVAQYAGGGTSNSSFFRRPVSALWNYIKGKISSVLGLTESNYSGKAATAGTADKAVADKSGNAIVNTYATKTEVNAKQDRLSAGRGIDISGNTVSTNLPLSNDNGATVKKNVWYIFAMANVTGGVWERSWDFLIASNHNSSAQMRLFISPRISESGLIDSNTIVQVDGHVTPAQLAKYKLATAKDSSGNLYCCLCVNHSHSNENRTVQWNLRNARGPSWQGKSTPLSNYTVVSERLLSTSMSSNRLVCYKPTDNNAVGNATQPVYVDAYGMIKACSSMPKFVIGTPAGAANTIYFT